MKNTAILTRENSVAQDNVSVEISKAGVVAIGVTSVLIGCWAVVCLVSGMISSGGPAELISTLFKSITG